MTVKEVISSSKACTSANSHALIKNWENLIDYKHSGSNLTQYGSWNSHLQVCLGSPQTEHKYHQIILHENYHTQTKTAGN
ncbi:hypothetical protein PRUPE_2G070700 [Prunus persica]|uniref:Uncharacterized protein n=1 Tax=Prunus persica TaxID=3760 RepID=A0A251QCD5_PRUPE|nr:hypothetical protein PRUPE_2G070700 [Prunus persica]